MTEPQMFSREAGSNADSLESLKIPVDAVPSSSVPKSGVRFREAKFGDYVRSKTDTAMKNEVLAKFVAHNICCLISAMYELNIEPEFWTNKTAEKVSA